MREVRFGNVTPAFGLYASIRPDGRRIISLKIPLFAMRGRFWNAATDDVTVGWSVLTLGVNRLRIACFWQPIGWHIEARGG